MVRHLIAVLRGSTGQSRSEYDECIALAWQHHPKRPCRKSVVDGHALSAHRSENPPRRSAGSALASARLSSCLQVYLCIIAARHLLTKVLCAAAPCSQEMLKISPAHAHLP